ncbi:MAG TPA: hypothetical protein VJT67_07245 [Longimicrobiaceae bacterium]|nr:hypothetical protein [Longimicrobiaceae bacterium]
MSRGQSQELSQADYDQRQRDLQHQKTPRTCRLQAEVRSVVDTLDAGDPKRARLEMVLLLLAAMADEAIEANDDDEAYVRTVLEPVLSACARKSCADDIDLHGGQGCRRQGCECRAYIVNPLLLGRP